MLSFGGSVDRTFHSFNLISGVNHLLSLDTMSPIPVALLGYGNSARTFHLPFVKSLPDQFQLHVVLQRPRPEGSTSPNATLDLPDVQVVPDIDAALSALPEGGLVIITTNNASHYPYAEKALRAKMHVLVEKPVAIHEDEVDKLAQLARSVRKVCTVYQSTCVC